MNAISAIYVLALLFATVPAAKVPHITARIDEGRDALRKKDSVRANELLTGALQEARAADDTIAAARALFYLGFMNQEMSQQASGDSAKRLRDAAIEQYEGSLALYPLSGSALYNLAEVYESIGNYDQAISSLQKGIDLDLPRKGMFAEKLGDIAADRNKHEDAVKAYELALQSSDVSTVRQKLVAEYLELGKGLDYAIPHLWKLAKVAPDSALSGAVRVLRGKGLSDDQVDALFGVIAAALAQQNYTAAQLTEIGIAQTLDELGKEPRYEPRVRAIVALYNGEVTPANQAIFRQWPEFRDLSPRRALGQLAAALGRRAYHQGRYDAADSYFQLAADLGLQTDPLLLVDIASSYYAQNRLSDVETLVERLESSLYQGQELSGDMDLEHVYEYHRALGAMYGWMQRWENPSRKTASAVYHLEEAVAVAEKISALRATEYEPPFPVDGSVLNLLADAYAFKGNDGKSVATRITAADAYLRGGDFLTARDVIARVPVSAVTESTERQRYASIVSMLVTLIGEGIPEWSNADLIKGCIVVLTTSKDRAIRNDAEEKLRAAGVRITVGPSATNGAVTPIGTRTTVQFFMRTSG